MSKSIVVFSGKDANAAIKADPTKVLTIEKKKEDKVYRGNTRYMNATFNIGIHVKKSGWFWANDIEITRGMAAPGDPNDKRAENENMRLVVQTTLSRCGEFGEFLKALNPQWINQVNTMMANGDIKEKGKKAKGLFQDKLSDNNTENPGGDIEDPIVRFDIDFKPYAATYYIPELRNTPKSQFLDYGSKYLDKNNKEQFKPAIVADPTTGLEAPVNANNVHLLVTTGSIIRRGRFVVQTVTIGKTWITLSIELTRAVMEAGPSGGFSDEVYASPEEVAAAVTAAVNPVVDTTNVVVNAVADTVATPVVEVPEVKTDTEVLTLDELNGLDI